VLSLFPLLVTMASLLGYVPIPHLFEGLCPGSSQEMHLWPILFAVLLVALIAGSLLYMGSALIQSLDEHRRLN
jgi:hypothetical protein